jgi:hypothetical protein
MKHQTPLEWFVEQLPIRILNMYHAEIQQAREMEKQHREKDMSDAFEAGMAFIGEDKGSWPEFLESKNS